jgi:putative SOS response-associated peptidase YedK
VTFGRLTWLPSSGRERMGPNSFNCAASHFYEFTGKRSPKDKWRFTNAGEDWFCIAGLWRPVEGDAPAFTMLTCEPGQDVAPIHNRQIVVLDRSEWAAWLNSQTAEEDLLKPSPPGSLKVDKVERAPGKEGRSKVTAVRFG